MTLTDPTFWTGIAILVIGIAMGWSMAAGRYEARQAPPGPVPMERPVQWPQDSLLARHCYAARRALERSMNTEAATEDALKSAAFFISKAVEEATKPQQESA